MLSLIASPARLGLQLAVTQLISAKSVVCTCCSATRPTSSLNHSATRFGSVRLHVLAKVTAEWARELKRYGVDLGSPLAR